MIKVQDIYDFLNKDIPFSAQESWDNSGLQTGDLNQEVNKIALVLDVTSDALKEAESFGADVIISHHPVLFRAVKSITAGNIAFEAIKSGISIISSHTSFDAANGGVSDILLEKIGAEPVSVSQEVNSCLRFGKVSESDVKDFARRVSDKLNAEIRFCCGNKKVQNIAVCGGSGCSLINDIVSAGADTFVTGDAGHHDFLDFQAAGINLIAAGHFETENIALFCLAERLKNNFPSCEVEVLNQQSPIQHLK